jgi:hypothetical protein
MGVVADGIFGGSVEKVEKNESGEQHCQRYPELRVGEDVG